MEKMVSWLRARITEGLPGEKAHIEMAPLRRPSVLEARSWADTRLSAVLVLLYPFNNAVYTSLMMRPDYDGVHSGQVSFPGGKKEHADKTMIATALREAREELGIDPDKVKIIGQLSELYIPPSKSLVTPILGFSKERPVFAAEKEEVEAIIEADVKELLDDRNFSKVEIVRSNYLMKGVPAFLYKGYTIWGATAMILNELKWLLRNQPAK